MSTTTPKDVVFESTPKRERINNNLIRLLIGLVLVVMLAVVMNFFELRGVKATQLTNRSVGFGNRSVGCLAIIVDNDRFFELPEPCTQTEVVRLYPDAVCVEFFMDEPRCGQEE